MSASKHCLKENAKSGFTLIELSIVLVIIGLIVGGILTGQDLIRSAEIRATIAQIEKYNTAVYTFKNKYGGLPGDLQESTAASFGLFAMSTATPVGGAGFGDGNGLIEGGASQQSFINGEVVAFFRHLSDAGLVDGTFAATGTNPGQIATDGTITAITAGNSTTAIPLLFPAAKIGRGNYITPVSYAGVNYFVISGMNVAIIPANGNMNSTSETNNLTGLESYRIDSKIDDGMPQNGNVVALNTAANYIANYPNLGILSSLWPNCILSATSYGINPGNIQACSLRIRFN